MLIACVICPIDCIVACSVASLRSMPRSVVDLFLTRSDVTRFTSAPVSKRAMTSSLFIVILICGLVVNRSLCAVPITVKRTPFCFSPSGPVFVSGPTATTSSLADPLVRFPTSRPHFGRYLFLHW